MEAMWKRIGRIAVPRLLGGVLLLASILKGEEVVRATFGGVEGWGSEWSSAAGMAFEAVLGLWLLLGPSSVAGWWLAIVSFSLFLGVSLDRALANESSCGCFGRVVIGPWYTFTFDLTAIAVLLAFQPQISYGSTAVRLRLAVFVSAVSLAAIVFVLALYFERHPSGIDGSAGASSTEIPPTEWAGKRLPLLKHIDIRNQLQRDHWRIMFFRRNCSLCQQQVLEFLRLAYAPANTSGRPKIALLELPPHEDSKPAERGTVFLRGRVREGYRWSAQVPFFVELREGVVTKASGTVDLFTRDNRESSLAREDQGNHDLPDYPRFRRERFLSEIACGPLSLVAVMHHLGHNLSPGEIDRLIAAAGSRGTDMLQLKKLAESQGLHALGVAVTVRQLKRTELPAVAYLDGIGFAAVLGYQADGVRVVYPTKAPGIMPEDLFERAFGKVGNALLISKTSINAESLGLQSSPGLQVFKGPHLRLSRSILAVGRIHSSNWNVTITIENDGTKPLVIGKVRTSCERVSASVGRSILTPGESTTLRASGKKEGLGSFTYLVLLDTNQPADSSRVTVPIRGYVEQPVGFDKPASLLRGVLARQSRKIVVHFDPSPGIDISQLKLDVPAGSPLEANILWEDQSRPAIAVLWKGVSQPGLWRYEIGVNLTDPKSDVRSTFQLAVEVVPEIGIFPHSLSIHADERAKRAWHRRVTVSSVLPLRNEVIIGWSDPRLASLFRANILPEGDRKFILEISRVRPIPGDIINMRRVAVTVRIPGSIERRLPILFLE